MELDPKGPFELAQAIEGHVGEIDRLGKLLDEAIDVLGEAEAVWVEARNDQLTATFERYAASTSRLPAQHMLEALVEKDNRGEWRTWQRAKLTVDKLKRAIAREETMQSGRQTQLKALEAEARMPDRDSEPAWSQTQRSPVRG